MASKRAYNLIEWAWSISSRSMLVNEEKAAALLHCSGWMAQQANGSGSGPLSDVGHCNPDTPHCIRSVITHVKKKKKRLQHLNVSERRPICTRHNGFPMNGVQQGIRWCIYKQKTMAAAELSWNMTLFLVNVKPAHPSFHSVIIAVVMRSREKKRGQNRSSKPMEGKGIGLWNDNFFCQA